MANYQKCNSPAKCCTNNNVCERTCIEVKKIFDACMQKTSESVTLDVNFENPAYPLTAVSVKSVGEGVITNLVITPLENSRCSRVSYTLTVPITVVATDSTGKQITGTTQMVFYKDLVLRVPQEGAILPTVEAQAIIIGVQNTLNQSALTTNACVTIITKVVADVILVIPSYGYPTLRECTEYTPEDLCEGAFDAPIFPR